VKVLLVKCQLQQVCSRICHSLRKATSLVDPFALQILTHLALRYTNCIFDDPGKRRAQMQKHEDGQGRFSTNGTALKSSLIVTSVSIDPRRVAGKHISYSKVHQVSVYIMKAQAVPSSVWSRSSLVQDEIFHYRPEPTLRWNLFSQAARLSGKQWRWYLDHRQRRLEHDSREDLWFQALLQGSRTRW
jgi:hypothetical protein